MEGHGIPCRGIVEYLTAITSASPPFSGVIPLNELSQWSPWVQWLLGLEPFSRKPRDAEEITREYDREKYASCREFLRTHPGATPEHVRIFEFGGSLEREICVSCEETLYRATVAQAWDYQKEEFLKRMKPLVEIADVICELGAGYGYYLWLLRQHFPQKRFVGGDVAPNAVLLGQDLLKGMENIALQHLDLTAPSWHLPLSREEKVLIFSFYTFHNLPVALPALETLIALKGEQWRVCLFEPVFGWYADSTLGLLRRAYGIRNDYNRDLHTALEQNPRVHIEAVSRSYFGMNPLAPASMVCWR